MRTLQVDLTERHSYLERHAQRYFTRRNHAQSLAQDSLERAANYIGIFEYGDNWTLEIESEIIKVLSQVKDKNYI